MVFFSNRYPPFVMAINMMNQEFDYQVGGSGDDVWVYVHAFEQEIF